MGLFALVLLVHPQPPMLAVGSTAPAITLQSSTGITVNALSRAAHHSLVVEFLETSCTTCQSEAGTLCNDSTQFTNDVFVAVGAGAESAAALTTFAAHYLPQPCAVTLLVDPQLQVTHAYEAAVVPTVYVVDGAGKIAYGGAGASGIQGVAAELQRLGD